MANKHELFELNDYEREITATAIDHYIVQILLPQPWPVVHEDVSNLREVLLTLKEDW